MFVSVDRERCLANGLCESIAGEVFEVGDDDVAAVRVDTVDDEFRLRVEEAARLCPTQAISVKG